MLLLLPLLAAPPVTPSALRPLDWFLGHWTNAEATETWVAAGDVYFGVGFGPGKDGSVFEVLTLERRDGGVAYVAQPGGGAPTPFTLQGGGEVDGGTGATFTNTTHDFPQWIHYERKGTRLLASIGQIGKSAADRYRWRAADPVNAGVLEEADRAFARGVAAGGSAAWVSWFDAHGFMRDDAGARVDPGPAMVTLMAPTLDGTLEWGPSASGFAPAGDLGFTIGSWTWSRDDKHAEGAYVTIWKKQADGGWKVWFDTGNPVDAPR
jgi:hypothetical protein